MSATNSYRPRANQGRRVVVTGIGVVTPLGSTIDTFWNGLTNGRSGISTISSFDADNYPVRIAAEVKNWTLQDIGESPRQWPRCPRQTKFSLGAGISAVNDSGIAQSIDNPHRFGVYLGCGEPFVPFDSFTQSMSTDDAPTKPLRVFDPDITQQYSPNMPALQLAARFGARGPNLNCIAACVSATQAIGQSMRMIRRGDADVMLCGGAHSCIHEFGVTGFSRLSALSQKNDSPTEASRPFDRDRDGFVIGEGAAVLVAEEYEHARNRGAMIYGEITGYGAAQDAYRVTDTHPEGRGTISAMKRALADSRLDPSDLDYINAHGTGTQLNDKVETESIKRAIGPHAFNTPISSIKSMLGHSTTACGAIELAACLLAMQSHVIPPTINLQNADPNCDLDYVANTARDHQCQHILSNNIGFGGQNAALVISNISQSVTGTVRRAA
ncbi:beta-ketoacyl-[acyl-carrier-protein] synthase family protein [Planctomycetes bacterium K23_9]|uniref:3-oxoacyl-[acyl-carrier-protein] synthase 2 n=1 Tax=Stieleria marina TaxID=1930275 RepID=A0A517P378_9BACT|nr:3-oxoacyl-[acyl-carrier-protein] synthase 2 [Planctomycetes bacterium K23_9]